MTRSKRLPPLKSRSFSLPMMGFLLIVGVGSATRCRAQTKPAYKADDEVTAFAFSAGGRVAYAARHVFSEKKIDMQRDDIWVAEPDGRKRRILQGERFVRGTGPFSYAVHGLEWSPDGSKLIAELETSEMINNEGDTREAPMSVLLDQNGGEIQIHGGDSTIPGTSDAAWLNDGATVAYLAQEKPEHLRGDDLFSVHLARMATGSMTPVFQGRLFAAVVWDAKHNAAVAVELPITTGSTPQPPRLVSLDLLGNTSQALATLDGYAGGLALSPSGKRAAYWVNNELLEVRDLDSPDRVARMRLPVGKLAWAADDARILVKRGPPRRSGDLVWIAVAPLGVIAPGSRPAVTEPAPQAILHDLEFRDFALSPDGRWIGVIEPGKRNLLVYPVP